MVIRNKKAWLRIVEASFAILLIFAVLLIVIDQKNKVPTNDLTVQARGLLEEVAKNFSLREDILSFNSTNTAPEQMEKNTKIFANLSSFIDSKISTQNLNFSVKICELKEICSLDNYPAKFDSDIYSAERVISTEVGNTAYGPKKVKVFLWYLA